MIDNPCKTPKETLKTYFGYDSFRPGQEEIVAGILEGRDILAIMPTGAGKSICYQVPALMLPGITVVISPLISLMQDQVKALKEAGIKAAYINSALSDREIYETLSLAKQGEYKLIYIAPERLESGSFLAFADEAQISMVTVDEAHCISQWGQDFRPSYLKIVAFVDSLKKRPIVSAFTATATEEVKTDIACILKLMDPQMVITGFDRENLYYRVEHIKRKLEFARQYIKAHEKESGVIYCATRKNVDTVYEALLADNIPVTRYHAGLSNEERKKNQDDFIYDRAPVIVATNAFGMGIDKSNVRYVIHYNMPQSMENYYQEAGRAGRDGEPSQCILLFSLQDIVINKFLLERKEFKDMDEDDIELVKQRDMKRLQVMEGYCKTTGCLRNYILEYFGEKTQGPCDSCGNCHREYVEQDMTEAAKWVINCIAETKGRYGLVVVLGTLLGANRARLRELGTNNYKSYGKLKDYSEAELRTLVDEMLFDGLIIQTEDKYAVLRMGDISPLKQPDAKVVIRSYKEKEPQQKQKELKKRKTDALTKAGYELFEVLRQLRLEIAREEAMPPYIIFSDKTLIDMCVKVPTSEIEMLNVSGVGANKYAKYGQRFLSEIHGFLENHPGVVLRIPMEEEDSAPVMVEAKPKKTKKTKVDFYLTKEDAGNYQYKDYCYISDIKEELNRICSSSDAKKVTTTRIWEFLEDVGLTKLEGEEEEIIKTQTPKGESLGIQMVEKIAKSGFTYSLLMYPRNVQEMIVDFFTQGEEEN